MAWEPTDKEKFDKFYLAGLGDDQLGRNFSSSRDKVQKYLAKRFEEGTLPRRGSFEPTPETVTDELDQLHLQVLKRLKASNTAISVVDLANDFDVSPRKVEEVITKLGSADYLVGLEFGHVKFAPPQAGLRSHRHAEYLDKTRTVRFAVMGDAHLCSKYARLDYLNTFYDICQQEGVTRVFDCGNMIDGEARFNKTDLLVHGMGNQMKFWAEHWPRREGITTEYICGDDHEGWYLQREGIDIGWHMQKVAEKMGRTDLKYLGYMEHDVDIMTPEGGATTIRIQHPGGGSAYAISYQPQKIVESLSGGEKPHILCLGHYHKHGSFLVRNVHVLQVGCFQDQTPFMRKKRLSAHLGGYICDLTQAPDGSVLRWTTTFIPFFSDDNHEVWQYRMD